MMMAGGAIALAACAGGTPSSRELDRQQVAIERWDHCVQRQAERLAASRDDSLDSVRAFHGSIERARIGTSGFATGLRVHTASRCEGYRRDVLNTYPPHMARHVSRLLDRRMTRHTHTALMARAARATGQEDAAAP